MGSFCPDRQPLCLHLPTPYSPQSSNAPSSMKTSFVFSNHSNSFYSPNLLNSPFLSTLFVWYFPCLFVCSFWSFVHMSILPVDWVLGWQDHMLCHPYYQLFGQTWHQGKYPPRTWSWGKSVESNHLLLVTASLFNTHSIHAQKHRSQEWSCNQGLDNQCLLSPQTPWSAQWWACNPSQANEISL